MVDVKAFHKHGVLTDDHVVVVVGGKMHVKAVRGLAGLTVTNVVGEDEKVLGDVEGLPRAEEFIGKQRSKQRSRVSAGSMKEEDHVVGVPLAIAMQGAKGQVVQVEGW